jgi:hypothetical protein
MQKNKSSLVVALEELYKPLGSEWVNQNSLVINAANRCGLTIGGSIAMAISRKKPHKIPGDIDYFTDNINHLFSFITEIQKYLLQRKGTNFMMGFNIENDYVLEGVKCHVRIKVPFWKPICVMVLKEPVRKFYWHKMAVQYFEDVIKAAKQATEIDGKERDPHNESFVEKLKIIENDNLWNEQDEIPFESKSRKDPHRPWIDELGNDFYFS